MKTRTIRIVLDVEVESDASDEDLKNCLQEEEREDDLGAAICGLMQANDLEFDRVTLMNWNVEVTS